MTKVIIVYLDNNTFVDIWYTTEENTIKEFQKIKDYFATTGGFPNLVSSTHIIPHTMISHITLEDKNV